MQIHRQNAIRTCSGDHVGYQLSRDGHASFVFSVLAGIAKVGNHRGDPLGAGAKARVNQDQQFHQRVVHGRAGRLHQKYVSAADVFDFAVNLTVGEGGELHFPQFQMEKLSNLFQTALDGPDR